MNSVSSIWKGVLFCLAIAVPSFILGKLVPVVGGPVFSILIGMVIAVFLKDRGSLDAGIRFSSKKILQ